MAYLGPTLVLYVVVGLGVALAVFISERESQAPRLWFRMMTALPFWPLYLPILLAHLPRASVVVERPGDAAPAPCDDMSAAIAHVDAELEAALNSIDGWAEDVLARERDRIRELRDAWIAQAGRVREMDHVLASGIHPLTFADKVLNDDSRKLPRLTNDSESPPVNHRMALSQEACRQNIERLRHVRQRAYDDLLGNLAWVRELVSMIHLAKFTGAPASRAEELVAQIAAAVEGLSDLTWREETGVTNAGNASVLE